MQLITYKNFPVFPVVPGVIIYAYLPCGVGARTAVCLNRHSALRPQHRPNTQTQVSTHVPSITYTNTVIQWYSIYQKHIII